MTCGVPLSLRIYARLMAWYPEELRRDYGADMALVFAEDLDAARQESGVFGALRIWRCAIGEFLRYGLPECMSNSAVRVPMITAAFTIASLFAGLLGRLAPMPLRALCCAVVSDFTVPGVALLCVWFCRGSALTSLNLTGDPPREP